MSPEALLRELDPLLRSFTTNLPAAASLSALDYFCLITLGIFALDGLRRGFLLGVLDVVAIAITMGAAVTLYPLVGGLLVEQVDMPGALANVLAFVGIVVGAQLLYQLGAGVLSAVLKGVFATVPAFGALDGVAGLLPGFVKGAIILALLASAVRALPMATEVRRIFDGSQVVQRISPIGAAVVPDIPALLSRLGLESTVVTPPPQMPSPLQRPVQFPPNLRTEVDAVSEARMLDLLNRERTAAGLGTLVADERLRESARLHSVEMFERSYFAHESPINGSPFDRMLRAGARFQMAGENLAYAPNVESAHRGLMNSPDHRRNILTPGFRRVGVGVVQAGSWGRMFTQNFAD